VTRSLRKERERHLLATFLQKERIEALVRDSESPDFLLTIDERVVGLEVTELHHSTEHPSSSLQAREAVASRVIAEAQQEFAKRGGPSLRVAVNFVPAFDPGTVQRNRLAEYLCALVERILPDPEEVRQWRPQLADYQAGTPLISYLHVYHQPQSIRPHWLHAEAGWVAPLTLELVQSAIDEKSERLPTYRLSAPEIWLLLAIDGRTPSQFFDTELRFAPSEVRSPFERTYLSEAFLGRAILLGRQNDV
jgi:hypothetical protein